MPFNATGPHHCPKCSEDPEFIVQRRKAQADESPALRRVRTARLLESVTLVLVEQKPGGADTARCPRCDKVFAISYGVTAVEEVSGEAVHVGE